MKKRLAVLLTSPLILSSVAMFGPSAAQAAPSDCHYEVNGKSVIGSCSQGSGDFRIRLDCNNWPDQTSAWTQAGRQAVATCGIEHHRGVTFEVR